MYGKCKIVTLPFIISIFVSEIILLFDYKCVQVCSPPPYPPHTQTFQIFYHSWFMHFWILKSPISFSSIKVLNYSWLMYFSILKLAISFLAPMFKLTQQHDESFFFTYKCMILICTKRK